MNKCLLLFSYEFRLTFWSLELWKSLQYVQVCYVLVPCFKLWAKYKQPWHHLFQSTKKQATPTTYSPSLSVNKLAFYFRFFTLHGWMAAQSTPLPSLFRSSSFFYGWVFYFFWATTSANSSSSQHASVKRAKDTINVFSGCRAQHILLRTRQADWILSASLSPCLAAVEAPAEWNTLSD